MYHAVNNDPFTQICSRRSWYVIDNEHEKRALRTVFTGDGHSDVAKNRWPLENFSGVLVLFLPGKKGFFEK